MNKNTLCYPDGVHFVKLYDGTNWHNQKIVKN